MLSIDHQHGRFSINEPGAGPGAGSCQQRSAFFRPSAPWRAPVAGLGTDTIRHTYCENGLLRVLCPHLLPRCFAGAAAMYSFSAVAGTPHRWFTFVPASWPLAKR